MNAMSLSAPALAQDKSIVVASTTSTQDSGLFGYLLPIFKEKTGIEVKVLVAAGKAANLAGERPVPSIARSRTASISDGRDQLTLVCSAGDRPARAKVRSLVVWMAGW